MDTLAPHPYLDARPEQGLLVSSPLACRRAHVYNKSKAIIVDGPRRLGGGQTRRNQSRA